MIGLLCFIFAIVVSAFKAKSRLEAENVALRHQLIILRRKVRGRVRLTNNDRWFFVQLYRWFPSILQVLTIIRPETQVRSHRAGFAAIGVGSRAHPADEHREPALGRATHPRRTAQAWV